MSNQQAVFTSGMPLLDVRSPIEYAAGSLPKAYNIPLLTDQQRQQIGTCYKQQGQQAAISLGLQLITDSDKQILIKAWHEFVKEHPEGALLCFRGGLRSRITQQWLYDHTGIRYPRLAGGYKAHRRFLLEQLENLPATYRSWILSGRTGSGKTLLLQKLPQTVDLEKLANHRGSAFGAYLSPQPAQASFENTLSAALLASQHAAASSPSCLLFEDESANIGSVHLPKVFLGALRQAPLIMLQVTLEQRVEITYKEYVCAMSAAFLKATADQEQGFIAFQDYLLNSLHKIRRRLGGERLKKAQRLMQHALQEQRQNNRLEGHQSWITFLLHDYYDPMYEYQLQKKQQRVVFAGNEAEVSEFWQQQITNQAHQFS